MPKKPGMFKGGGGGLQPSLPGGMTALGGKGQGLASGALGPFGPTPGTAGSQSRQTTTKDASELPEPLKNQILGKIGYFSPDGILPIDPNQPAEDQPPGDMQAPKQPGAGKNMEGRPFGAKGPASFGGAMFGGADPKFGSKTPAQMPTNPMALVRFVDVDVEPGATYQYRVQIRMANPNYKQSPKIVAHSGLAKLKELVSEWVETGPLLVPSDFQYYIATQEKDKDLYSKIPVPKGIDRGFSAAAIGGKQVPFQVHRFVDSVSNDGNEIGDWLVAERLLVARGEAIGRECEVEAVRWQPTKAMWEIATGVLLGKIKKGTLTPGVVVDFHTDPPVVLLDFVGGRQVYPKPGSKNGETHTEESAYEVLLLLPDGTMAVRNSKDDADDKGWNEPELATADRPVGGNPAAQERRRRYEQWKAHIEETRNAMNPNNQNLKLPGGGADKNR